VIAVAAGWKARSSPHENLAPADRATVEAGLHADLTVFRHTAQHTPNSHFQVLRSPAHNGVAALVPPTVSHVEWYMRSGMTPAGQFCEVLQGYSEQLQFTKHL
jgi:hypothetical protein